MDIKHFIENPSIIFFKLKELGLLEKMPDEQYLKLMYKAHTGRKLNLKSPQTYNEKLQWLKLHDRKALYTSLVDKYLVKDYVASLIGSQYVIPNYGVWDSFSDIDFDMLPEKFVIKCTHDSGGVVICSDWSSFDIEKCKEIIEKSLSRNFFSYGREWPYKNVQPRIIAEQYLDLQSDAESSEYKLFCFKGQVKAILVCKGIAHSTGVRTNDYFDSEFNHLPIKTLNPNYVGEISRPKEMDLMVDLAKQLSANIPQVRVDFYLVDGRIYFGELTLFHNSGFWPFDPPEYDSLFGSWIDLSDLGGGIS